MAALRSTARSTSGAEIDGERGRESRERIPITGLSPLPAGHLSMQQRDAGAARVDVCFVGPENEKSRPRRVGSLFVRRWIY